MARHDAEALVEGVREAVDEGIVVAIVAAHHVRGHGDFAGAQRPEVEVVQPRVQQHFPRLQNRFLKMTRPSLSSPVALALGGYFPSFH